MNNYSQFSIDNQNQPPQTSNPFPVTYLFGAGDCPWSMHYLSSQQTLSHPCQLNVFMMGSGHTSFHLVQEADEEDESQVPSQISSSRWMEVVQQCRGVANDGARKSDEQLQQVKLQSGTGQSGGATFPSANLVGMLSSMDSVHPRILGALHGVEYSERLTSILSPVRRSPVTPTPNSCTTSPAYDRGERSTALLV
ncbi:unnamed protein product [Orchesella dallaii]|uniref:Uncharacterized protein n=1 Tax=Orchesella dallaii TaxID=48710 RepID=A0ABP1R558_9HEXA